MKNAWIAYVLIRLGLFLGFLIVLTTLGIDPFLAAIFAAILGLAISLLFLNKQRDRISSSLYERTQKKATAEVEDELLEKDAKKRK